tara:strand:- start:4543 stop:5376 length:834 start_codon:yes stop_codon:yes gene_type:complete
MANSAYGSGISLDALMVNTKAATVFQAQEASLFLGGALIPMVNVPAGSMTAQVPVLNSVAATKISSEATVGSDLETVLPTDTKVLINVDVHAARTVLRDLGGVDANDIGRQLGAAVSKSFDEDCAAALGNLTAQEVNGSLDLAKIFAGVETIRGAGETGQLYGIISTSSYTDLMVAIGNAAYAGGDFQTEALRNGFVGNIAGVQMFVSSYLNDTNTGAANTKCAIFGADAMRIAMQRNVDLEVERRAAAVGFDVVASLHAGVGVVDATRGVLLADQT